MLEQLGRLVEQVDRDQPVGQPADHLVAAAPDRRQLAEIVEQRQCLDGRHGIAFAGEKQRIEGCRRLVLDAAGQIRIGMRLEGSAHDVESLAVAPFLGVEVRQQLQGLDLGFVAAPEGGEGLEPAG